MKNTVRIHRNGAKKSPTSQAQNPVSKFQQRCIKAARKNKPEVGVYGAGFFALSAKCKEAIEAQAQKAGVDVDTFIKTFVRPDNEKDSLGEFVIPEDAPHGSCLAMFSREDGGAAYKIPLTEKEFYALVFHTAKTRVFTGDFVADAVRKALAAPADDGLSNLEITCTKVEAILQLLADKFEHLAYVDAGEFSGQHAKHFCAGLGYMVLEAQENLRAAFEKTFHAACAKTIPEVPEQALAA